MDTQSKDAISVIKRHWNKVPVDVFAIIKEIDGLELCFPVLPDDISGMIEKVPGGRYRISVNNKHAMVRKRFTAAHELGHYIYHRSLIGSGVDDNIAYRRSGQTAFNDSGITQAHETQAHRFAANLLMPQHLIDSLKNRGVNSPAALAQALGVSEAAMRIRMGLYDAPQESATAPALGA